MSVAQLCLALCDPVDCSPPGSSVLGDSPGKNTRVGCHSVLQGTFLAQGSNLGLLHCRQFKLQFHSQLMLIECTFTSLKVHSLKFCM